MHTDSNRHQWIIYLGWAAAAFLCLALLTPVFSMLWNKNTSSDTLVNCRLIADSVAKRRKDDVTLASTVHSADDSTRSLSVLLAGWSAADGSLDTDALADMAQEAGIGTLAIRDPDGMRVIAGSLSEENFDDILYSLQEAYADSEDPGSGEVDFDGTLWAVCQLKNSRSTILGSLPDPSSGNVDASNLFIDTLLSRDTLPKDTVLISADLSTGLVDGVSGTDAVAVGDAVPDLPEGEDTLTLGDRTYTAASSSCDDHLFIAALPGGLSRAGYKVPPSAMACCFVLLLVLVLLYAGFLRTDIARGRIREEDTLRIPGGVIRKAMFRRIRLMAICVTVIILSVSAVWAWLMIIDGIRLDSERTLEEVNDYFYDSRVDEQYLDAVLYGCDQEHAAMIASQLAADPSLLDHDALCDLKYALSADIFVLNRDGTVAAGTGESYDFSGLEKEDSELYALAPVLSGQADRISTTLDLGGRSYDCSAVQRADAPGMLLYLTRNLNIVTSESVYGGYPMPDGTILFAVDLKSGKLISCSDSQYIGKDVSRIGMTEDSLADGFTGTLRLNGRSFFLTCDEYDGVLGCIAVSYLHLLRVHLPLLFGALLIGTAAVFLLLLVLFLLQRKYWTSIRVVQTSQDGEDLYYEDENGEIRTQSAAVDRWSRSGRSFSTLYADEKLRLLIHILLLALTVSGFFLMRQGVQDAMVGTLPFLMSRRWQIGFNIYAISYSFVMVTVIFVTAMLLRRLVLFIGRGFGTRGETIARLTDSFISYSSMIAALCYGLYYLGINTTALLASAGIAGLCISFGAKDLVSDILAGISIVFDGEFRTGDIVEIAGYRGTVQEIGIRTTKITADGNVKIFRNSNISGVVNMTQRYSIAEVSLQVARSEPLDKVEKIILRELPLIRRRIPEIDDDIRLLGVSEVSFDYVTLTVTAKCAENVRRHVIRSLNRELDMMMAREGIRSRG